MSLPELENFQAMIQTLHQALEIVAPLHGVLREKENNWLHLPMQIEPYGLSSGSYPNGGNLTLDFKQGQLIYTRPSDEKVTFKLADHTQASLFNAVLAAMKTDILADYFADISGENLAEGFMLKRNGGNQEAAAKALATYTHTDKLVFDTKIAGDYADAVYAIFTGVARFRARLNGHLTPIVVWPEHFDLSTLWFADGAMDDTQAHINFGFAPYTPQQYERPYFYAYAYPYPDNFTEPNLPSPAFWNPTGWRGVVINYDDIAAQDNPALYIEQHCKEIFEILKSVLDSN